MVSWYDVTSQTRAQIQDGVTVNGGTNPNGAPVQGGAVNVEADDNTILVGVTGGAVTGNHIGVGFAIAVNNLNRTTLALIGSTSTPTKLGSFDISSLAVNATDEGQVGTLTYSAATISPSEGQVKSNSNPLPLAQQIQTGWFNYNQLGLTNPITGQSGFGLSGAASVNLLQSDTEAYVNDAGTFTTPTHVAPCRLIRTSSRRR